MFSPKKTGRKKQCVAHLHKEIELDQESLH